MLMLISIQGSTRVISGQSAQMMSWTSDQSRRGPSIVNGSHTIAEQWNY